MTVAYLRHEYLKECPTLPCTCEIDHPFDRFLRHFFSMHTLHDLRILLSFVTSMKIPKWPPKSAISGDACFFPIAFASLSVLKGPLTDNQLHEILRSLWCGATLQRALQV